MRLNQKHFALISFAVGLIFAVIVFSTPGLRKLTVDLERSGYTGVFVTGILYATNLTAATAAAIFFDLPDRLHPVAAAVIGGLGAVAYDLTIFSLFRKNSHAQWLNNLKQRLPGRARKVPNWALNLVGILIVASPLPDELGVGFLGSSSIRPSRFIIVSFLANSGGILALQLLHRA